VVNRSRAAVADWLATVKPGSGSRVKASARQVTVIVVADSCSVTVAGDAVFLAVWDR
jgi:hypothetical protein